MPLRQRALVARGHRPHGPWINARAFEAISRRLSAHGIHIGWEDHVPYHSLVRALGSAHPVERLRQIRATAWTQCADDDVAVAELTRLVARLLAVIEVEHQVTALAGDVEPVALVDGAHVGVAVVEERAPPPVVALTASLTVVPAGPPPVPPAPFLVRCGGLRQAS